MKQKQPIIMFWDIETAPLIATTWGLYPKSIPHEGILQDWFIICGAWRYSTSDKIHAVAINKVADDYAVTKALRNAVAKADVIVHHNGNKFDIKKLNARIIFHGLDPLPPIPMVDTLREIKKIAAFSSNRLDYLAKTLVGKGKLHTSPSLWLEVLKGSKQAVKDMVTYNKIDVIRLQQVYKRLVPYFKNHPHLGAMSGLDRNHSCPKCQSTNLHRNGYRFTATGLRKQEVKCLDCGSYHRISTNEKAIK